MKRGDRRLIVRPRDEHRQSISLEIVIGIHKHRSSLRGAHLKTFRRDVAQNSSVASINCRISHARFNTYQSTGADDDLDVSWRYRSIRADLVGHNGPTPSG